MHEFLRVSSHNIKLIFTLIITLGHVIQHSAPCCIFGIDFLLTTFKYISDDFFWINLSTIILHAQSTINGIKLTSLTSFPATITKTDELVQLHHQNWWAKLLGHITKSDEWNCSDTSPKLMSDTAVTHHQKWWEKLLWHITKSDEWNCSDTSPKVMSETAVTHHQKWWVKLQWHITKSDEWNCSDTSPKVMSETAVTHHQKWWVILQWHITKSDEWYWNDTSPKVMSETAVTHHQKWWVILQWHITKSDESNCSDICVTNHQISWSCDEVFWITIHSAHGQKVIINGYWWVEAGNYHYSDELKPLIKTVMKEHISCFICDKLEIWQWNVITL